MAASEAGRVPNGHGGTLIWEMSVKVTDTNLQEGIEVYIVSDTIPWTSVRWKSTAALIIKGGKKLKAKVAQGVPHSLRFVNSDGGVGTATFQY